MLGVVALAVLAVAAVAYSAPGMDSASIKAAVFFSILGILAHALAYQLPRGVTGNITFIPFLSAVVVAPALPVVLAIAIGVAIAEGMQKRELLKAIFNVAQNTLSVAGAVLVFVAGGGTPVTAGPVASLIPFVAAFATFFVLNTICVSGVVAISRHQQFSEVFRQNTQGALLYDIFAIPVVYGFAYVYVRLGPQWALAMAVPLFGLRQLYKTNWQLEQINEELLQIMVAAIEARDPYTSGHSQRVAAYSRIVAKAAGLSPRVAARVSTAALLHDVGKIHEEFAPILRKPGRLTEEEFAVMRTHSEKGAALVAKVSQFQDLVPAVRSHHEAWDGSGYPHGLQGEAIPVWARVIALADTIDAMTTDRPYRAAMDAVAVRAEIQKMAALQFDPSFAAALTSEEHWPGMAQAIGGQRVNRRPTPLGMDAIPRHSATFPVAAR